MLGLVEVMSLVVSIYDEFESHQSTSSVIYDEDGISLNISGQAYKCFVNVSQCIYEHNMLNEFKMTHIVFIGITILAYLVIFITLRPQWQGISPPFIQVTYLGIGKGVAMLMLALNTILLVVIFRIDHYYIKECGKYSFIVRLENMLTYIVLNCIEAFYIMHDILSTSHKTGMLTPYQMLSRAASTTNLTEETPILHQNNNNNTTLAFRVNYVEEEDNH